MKKVICGGTVYYEFGGLWCEEDDGELYPVMWQKELGSLYELEEIVKEVDEAHKLANKINEDWDGLKHAKREWGDQFYDFVEAVVILSDAGDAD